MKSREPARPTAAVLVSMNPISPKATALFDELSSVASVEFIFGSDTVDTHAAYSMTRKQSPLAQMLNGDFGYWRLLMERLNARWPPPRFVDYTRDVLASTPIDTNRQHSWEAMADMTGAEVVPFKLRRISRHRCTVDEGVESLLMQVDFAVLLSFNVILTGPVLDAPRYGIWSFHPADTQRYRGRPSCFFEVLDGSEYFGMTLQVLVEEIDAGPILCQRFIPANACVGAEQARFLLEHQQVGMIREAVDAISRSEVAFSRPNLEKSKIHRESDANGFRNALRYVQKTFLRQFLLRRSPTQRS